MNILRPMAVRFMAIVVASALCLPLAARSAPAGETPAGAQSLSPIQTENGAAEFAPGDIIVITSLRGSQPHLETGGRYVLEGSYVLASADSADLAWFSTSRSPGSTNPVTSGEHVTIAKGSGTFHLEKTLLDDGWLHASFYIAGQPHGGIYFGEKGLESTVLRKKSWSDFSIEPKASPSGGSDGASSSAKSAGLTIMSYLGDPIPAPADLDAKYFPAGLRAAFIDLSKKEGLHVKRLAVDDSEFPFLLYGVLAGPCDFHVFENGLRQMKGYEYGGSVVGATDNRETNFSLNMIPYGQLPSGRAMDCNRRLVVRLQMLADNVRANPQATGPNVLVLFDHPEKFADIRDRYFPTDDGENLVMADFREFITQRSASYLPGGYAFYIRFTDMKLAGSFPSQQYTTGPSLMGAYTDHETEGHRMISGSTPPAFMFTYAVTNRSGKVVKEGSVKLAPTRSEFMGIYTSFNNDLYYFDHAVLDSWMRENLQK